MVGQDHAIRSISCCSQGAFLVFALWVDCEIDGFLLGDLF